MKIGKKYVVIIWMHFSRQDASVFGLGVLLTVSILFY